MKGVTLDFYKMYVRGILRDFDVRLTHEIKTEITMCKTQTEVNRVKNRLIDERLSKEVR